MSEYILDWSPEAAKRINGLDPILIMPPREMSKRRLIQFVKHYLPKGNMVLGVSREKYVRGFENQPQFRTLQLANIDKLIDQINAASKRHKLYVLQCSQNDLADIAEQTQPQRVLMVNGSWQYVVHRSEVYIILDSKKIPIKLVSPFADEDEARQYESRLRDELPPLQPSLTFTEREVPSLLAKAAARSYDYSFQTSVLVAKRTGDAYELLLATHNRVIPYETYALHHGSAREIHKSALHDVTHYNTIHAEMDALIQAQKQKIDLNDTILFINLLPCPNCARTLSQTDIAEYMYIEDHSGGYAIEMLELAGKQVTRLDDSA